MRFCHRASHTSALHLHAPLVRTLREWLCPRIEVEKATIFRVFTMRRNHIHFTLSTIPSHTSGRFPPTGFYAARLYLDSSNGKSFAHHRWMHLRIPTTSMHPRMIPRQFGGLSPSNSQMHIGNLVSRIKVSWNRLGRRSASV
jgi:hypothetical protein